MQYVPLSKSLFRTVWFRKNKKRGILKTIVELITLDWNWAEYSLDSNMTFVCLDRLTKVVSLKRAIVLIIVRATIFQDIRE